MNNIILCLVIALPLWLVIGLFLGVAVGHAIRRMRGTDE